MNIFIQLISLPFKGLSTILTGLVNLPFLLLGVIKNIFFIALAGFACIFVYNQPVVKNEVDMFVEPCIKQPAKKMYRYGVDLGVLPKPKRQSIFSFFYLKMQNFINLITVYFNDGFFYLAKKSIDTLLPWTIFFILIYLVLRVGFGIKINLEKLQQSNPLQGIQQVRSLANGS